MSFSTTISAILRDKWLIDRSWVEAHKHLIQQMIQGKPVDWGMESEKQAYKDGDEIAVPPPEKIAMIAMDENEEVYKAAPWRKADEFPNNSIVMLDIVGPILKYGDYCSYGSVDRINALNRFANARNIAGIILNFDTPGGQASGTAQFADTIRQAVAIKPVIGIVQNGIAASAGKWLLSACQEAYVTEDTDEVGSIGAYTTIYDFAGWLEKEGIKEYSIYAPQSTDKNKDYRDVIESKGENTALVEEGLKFLVDDFIGDVKAFRGQRLRTDKENPFTGKMYRAAEATKIGLIDGKKSLPQVIKRMRNLISLREKKAA